jgi:uncharacterized membrane protein YbhN (UPF0104 family)
MTEEKIMPGPGGGRLSTLLRWVGTVITIFIFGYFINQHWEEFREGLSLFGIRMSLLIVIVTVLSRLFISFRWHFLLRVIEPRVKPRFTISTTFAGLFASNFMPTTIGGDIFRLAAGVSQRYDATHVASSLILDRLIGMFGMILALPLNLVYLTADKLRELTTPATAVVALPVWLQGLTRKARSAFDKLMQTLALWKDHPGSLALALLSTAAHMGCLYFTLWLLFERQGEHISFIMVAGLWSLSYFFTLIPISINGYGLQELSITFLYTHIGGASMEASLVTALMIRVAQAFASLPGAFFIPQFFKIRQKYTENADESYLDDRDPDE